MDFTYDTIPEIRGQRLLIIDRNAVFRWRFGYHESSRPTVQDVRYYRESVPVVLRNAISRGYLVVTNTHHTADGEDPLLIGIVSRALRDGPLLSHSPRILFTNLTLTEMERFLLNYPPSRDSIFIDRYGPGTLSHVPGYRSNLLAEMSGTLWFRLNEVFPAKPLPNLTTLAFPDKINVYVIISDSPAAITKLTVQLLQQGDVTSVPNVGDLLSYNLREYLGKSVVSRSYVMYRPICHLLRDTMMRIMRRTSSLEGLGVVFTLLQLDIDPYIWSSDGISLATGLDSTYTDDFADMRQVLVRGPIKVEPQ